MKKVVIVGGGFGGFYAVKHLANKGFDITLVSPQDYFLFVPLLVEFAFNDLREDEIKLSFSMILPKNVKFVKAYVESIDLKKNVVRFNGNDLNYDYLVVAIGGTTGFFGVDGAREFSFTFTNIEDCYQARKRIEEIFSSFSKETDPEKRINFVIVGGGVGVSIVCGLKKFCEKLARKFGVSQELINISIVFMEKMPLQLMDVEQFSKLAEKRLEDLGIKIFSSSTVSKVGKDFIEVGRQKLSADMVIWTAGVEPNKILVKPNMLEEGHLKINEFLQIGDFNNAYALGDCSLSPERFSKTAQVTIQQAGAVVRNIMLSDQDKNLGEFVYRHKGNLMCLGNFYGVAHVGNFIFSGFFAWFLWKIIHILQVKRMRMH